MGVLVSGNNYHMWLVPLERSLGEKRMLCVANGTCTQDAAVFTEPTRWRVSSRDDGGRSWTKARLPGAPSPTRRCQSAVCKNPWSPMSLFPCGSRAQAFSCLLHKAHGKGLNSWKLHLIFWIPGCSVFNFKALSDSKYQRMFMENHRFNKGLVYRQCKEISNSKTNNSITKWPKTWANISSKGMKCEMLGTQSCLFEIPWTVAHQVPLSMGFSRQEYVTRLPFPSPGDLPNPRIKPRSPTLRADFFTIWTTREAHQKG